ncbi:MAG: MMPL family transporter, partial [Candidatus Binatia bacterium]|nr:MMPL family transporter [Candidatus Binatia bacterium]
SFYLAGRPIVMGHLYLFLKKMVLFFGIAIGLIMAMLLVAFRTWRGVFIPLWAGLVTVIWGLGMEAFWGMEMDIMTVIVPFMIMAIEVSHSVQFLNRYYEEYALYGDNQKACEATIAGLLPPGVASIITDGAGFATLTLVPFRLLQQMGWSATYGVIRIFFTTLIFLPAFLSILPPPKEAEMERFHRGGRFLKSLLGRIASLTYGRGRYAVVAVGIAFLVIGAIGADRVQVGDLQEGDPLFWAGSEYNRSEKLLNARFSGTNPYMVYVAGTKPRDILDPGLVREVHNLQRHLEEMPQVGGSRSYTDVMKRLNMAFHNNDPRWEVLPRDRDMVGQYVEMFMSSGGPDDYRSYFEIDLREAAVHVFLKDRKGKTISDILHNSKEFIADTQQSCARIEPGGGLIGIFAAIIEEIRRGQIEALLQISAVVLLFCIIIYRSLTGGLMILIPLGMGTLITFAVMGFGSIGLFLYTLPVASLGMGLGVDYSVYVVSRMREECDQGKDSWEAFRETMTTAGMAVFYTAMSVAIGVITLLLSQVRFQAVMGGMLAVIIIANMLGALLLLPALISWWRPRFIFRGKARTAGVVAAFLLFLPLSARADEAALIEGIERWLVRPIEEYRALPQRSEDYNALLTDLQDLPDWLLQARDLEAVREKLSAYEQKLMTTLDELNTRILRLGIYNTQWYDRFVHLIDLDSATHLLDAIRVSLSGHNEGREKTKAWRQRICRNCIAKLREFLLTLPRFTEEFEAGWSYMIGKEATYSGDRVIAALALHFREFNRISIRSLSPDPEASFSISGEREILLGGRQHPDYRFRRDPPPIFPDSDPVLSPWLPFLGKEVQRIETYRFNGWGDEDRTQELRCLLLVFQDAGAGQAFLQTGKAGLAILGAGSGEVPEILELERIRWGNAERDYNSYARRAGKYLLIIRPWKGEPGEVESMAYLKQSLIGGQ